MSSTSLQLSSAVDARCNRMVRKRFASFEYDTASGHLMRGGEAIRLRPKTLSLLGYLLEHPGRLVSKEELFSELWADAAVSQGVLNVCLTELRHALHDDPKRPRFLETVHRRGIRFVAELYGEEDATSHAPDVTPAPTQRLQRLVGRTAQWQAIEAAWHDAKVGLRRAVWIHGESGIGKTALLAAALEAIGTDPATRIAATTCGEHATPGQALLDLTGVLCSGVGSDAARASFAALAPAWLEEWERWRELAGSPATCSATREPLRGRAWLDAIDAIAARRPLVLAIDDAERADPLTLQALHQFHGRKRAAPVMLLCALREQGATPENALLQLPGLTEDRVPQARSLRLELLSHADIEAYLHIRLGRSSVTSGLVAELERRTGGLPLFLEAAIDLWLRQDAARRSVGSWHAPVEDVGLRVDSIEELWRDRMMALPVAALGVLEAASLLGREFAVQFVAAGCELSPERVELICRELELREGFLVDLGPSRLPDGTVGQVYRFRHEVLREVIDVRLPAAHRQALHRRIGTRLGQAYRDREEWMAGRLAKHAVQGGDDFGACMYFELAAATAERRGIHAEAVTLLEEALACLRRCPTDELRSTIESRLTAKLTALSVRSGESIISAIEA